MFRTIFVLLVFIWLVVWFFFVKDFKKMGGKVPLLLGPFTIPRMLDEYIALCETNRRRPVYNLLIYSLFGVFVALVITVVVVQG